MPDPEYGAYERRASFNVGRPVAPTFNSRMGSYTSNQVPEDAADKEVRSNEEIRQDFQDYWSMVGDKTGVSKVGEGISSGLSGAKNALGGVLKHLFPMGDTGWGSSELTHQGKLKKFSKEYDEEQERDKPYRTPDEDLPEGAVRYEGGQPKAPMQGQEGWDDEGGNFIWEGSGKPGDVWKVYENKDNYLAHKDDPKDEPGWWDKVQKRIWGF